MRSIEELGINNTIKLPVPKEDNFLSLPLGSNSEYSKNLIFK